MAQRVNTRMLVILIAALSIFVVGVIGAAWYAQRKSPERFIARGEALLAEGDLSGAAKAFGFAVGKEPGNLAYLDLWMNTLEQVVAPNEIEARENFTTLTSIIRQRAQMHSYRADLHLEWLEYLRQLGETTNALSDYQTLLDGSQFMLESLAVDDPDVVHGRRYRGIALAGLMSAGAIDDDSRRTQAREDLDAALAADATDVHAMSSLVRWHLAESERARQRNHLDRRVAELEDAIGVADRFLETSPDSVHGRLIRFALHQTLAAARAQPGAAPAELGPEEFVDLEVAERAWLATEDPASIGWLTILDLSSQLASAVRPPNEGMQRAIAVLDHRLATPDSDVRLLMARGRFQRLLGDLENAFATFESVVEHPDLPTSHAALLMYGLRRQALLEQFKIAAAQWAPIAPSDPEAWAAARDRTRKTRDRYASYSLETDPTLLYMDGRLALGEGENERATRLLERARENTGGDNVDVLLAAAEALLRLGQSGPAYERLREADELSGGRRLSVIVQMAEIDFMLDRMDAAASNAARVLAVQPGNAGAQRVLDRVRLARGEVRRASIDPAIPYVQQAIESFRASGRHEDAIAALEEGLGAHPDSRLLLREAAIISASAGDVDRAIAYATRTLAVDPEDHTIQILSARLQGEDITPIVTQIAEAEAAQVADPAAAMLVEAEVFNRYELSDEATRLVEQAAAAYPEHRRVVSVLFDRALRGDDLAAAEQLTQVAIDNNLDEANGRTYTGRLQLARGDTNEGVTTLRSAAEVKPWDNQLWRWLGQGYEQQGDVASARQAYDRSLENKPDDPDTLRLVAELEARQGDPQTALLHIREASQLAPNNPAVERVFLELEGRYGNRDRIIAYRRAALERGRGGLENRLALIRLLTMDGRADEAALLFEGAAPTTSDEAIELATARADLDVAEGGVETGRQRFIDLAAEYQSEDAVLARIYLALGSWLLRQGDEKGGLAAFRIAQRHQDPTGREADRRLGEFFFTAGDFARALEHWIPVGEANPSDEALSLRIIQTSVLLANTFNAQSNTFDVAGAAPGTPTQSANEAQVSRLIERANGLLADHLTRFGPSLETDLFQATLAVFAEDWEVASTLYSRAVQNHPDERQAYVARARFNLARYVVDTDNRNARQAELERDLAFLRERDPKDTEPYLLEAQLAAARRDPSTGAPAPDVEAVLARYYEVLEIEPRNTQIRNELIRQHVSRGEFDRATVLVRDAQQIEPDNANWDEAAAAIQQARGDRPAQVIRELESAFAKESTAERLGVLVRAILRSTPSQPLSTSSASEWRAQVGAQALLTLSAHPDLVSGDASLQMLEAQALAMTGDAEQGQKILETVYRERIVPAPRGPRQDSLFGEWLEASANTVLLRSLPVFVSRVTGPWSEVPANFALQAASLYSAIQPRALTPEVQDLLRDASASAAEAAVATLEAASASADAPDERAALDARRLEAVTVMLTAYVADARWDSALAVADRLLDEDPGNPDYLELRGRIRSSRGDAVSDYLPDVRGAYLADPTPARLAAWVQAVVDLAQADNDPTAGGSESMSPDEVAAEADRALAALNTAVTDGVVVETPTVTFTRIRLVDAAGRAAEARKLLAESYPGRSVDAPGTPTETLDRALVAWYAAASDLVGPLDMRAFFGELDRARPDNPRERWILGRYLLSEAQQPGNREVASKLLNETIAALAEAWDLLPEDARRPPPADVVAYNVPLGTAHALAEQWSDAVAAWERVVAVEPGHIESLNNLAFVLADKLNRASDALRYAERAYAAQPGQSSIVDTYGLALLRNDQPEKAESVLKPLIRPTSPPEHRVHYAEALMALGRTDEAQELLAAARQDAEAMGRLSLVDNIDALVASLEGASVTLGPDGPEN